MLDSLPEDWQKVTLADLAKIVGGTTPKRNVEKYWENGEICWATPTDITALPKSCYELHDTKEKISTSAVEEGGAKILPKDTVLMTSRATIGYVAIARAEMATNQGFANFLPSSSYVPKFLCYFLESRRAELIANSGGSTFKEISKASLKRLFVLLPPLAEQQRIAEILTSVDDSIRATEAVIAQAERVKRGLMEDLLTGGLGSAAIARGEVPEGWKDCTFDQLVLSIVGGVSVNSLNTPAADGEKGVLKTSAVSDGWFDMNENKVVFDEKEIARLKEPIQAGTIIFSRMNTPKLVGANAYVAQRNEYIFLPDRLWAIKPNETKVDANWLGFWMHHQFKTGSFEALGTGTSGSMKNISKKKLNAMKVAKPTLEKQMHVVSVLNAVNDQILSNRSSLAQLQRLKRGLMDDLLTGRVRTV